jgi:hypothetical protein
MVKKIDKSKSTNVKVKQKQNVNVRVNIDQRNTKKKPRKKRSNIPSAKREGVSSFSSSSFTPVYIQSGNPYPNYPQAPDIQPIRKNPVSQEVHTLVNPPVTSTTNLIQQVQSRSISPLSFEENSNSNFSEMYPNVSRRNSKNDDIDNHSGVFTFNTKINKKPKITMNSSDSDTSSLSLGSVYSLNDSAFFKTPKENKIEGVSSYEKGLMYPNIYDDASEIFSRDVKPIKIRKPRRTKKEMEDARGMGENDERAIQKEKEKLEKKNKKNN